MRLHRQIPPLVALLVALMAAAGCEVVKSESPLSPSVAGPIKGVNITAPTPLEPADGRSFKPKEQPITLSLQNAASTGVRPLYYRIELATDADFANVLLTNPNVAQGEGGRTSLRLPDALASDRTYYWRARAEDGANTGPYAVSRFIVLAPVVIEAPVPVEPIGGAKVSGLSTVLKVNNARRTGPAGAVTYRFEVATDSGFGGVVGAATVGEGSGQTTWTAGGLSYNKTFYWRVQASEPDTTSPWSAVESFVTGTVPPPTPTPTPGGPCTSKEPQAILQCRRSQYGAHMSASETFSFLRGSASDINNAGTAGGPWGLLVKTGGSQCNGYACDILCLGNGSNQVQRDVLLDSDGAQIPVWGEPMSGSQIAVRQCVLQ